jgi:hypothetical protein
MLFFHNHFEYLTIYEDKAHQKIAANFLTSSIKWFEKHPLERADDSF